MNILSYYISIRKRWSLIPRLWNKFFSNLEHDYGELSNEIINHNINDAEDELQSEINTFIEEKNQ